MHAVELAPDVAPGVARRVLDHPAEEEPEPELDVGADALLVLVEDRSEPKCPLPVRPPAPYPVALLGGVGEVGRGEGVVGGVEEPLAVEVGVSGDRSLVDTQFVILGRPAEGGETWAGPELADGLVTALLAPLAAPGDALLQVGDEVRSHDLVSGFGVDTDTEALGSRSVAAPTQIHPVRLGVEPTRHPEHPMEHPASEVVLHASDGELVRGGPCERPERIGIPPAAWASKQVEEISTKITSKG